MRITLLLSLLLVPLSSRPAFAEEAKEGIFAHARALGRGINLGNALEAPKEGAWGVKLEAGFFPLIKKAGFDSVRLPVKWSAHAGKEAPYTIDPTFFERVEWAVDEAIKAKLIIVVNVHHYDEITRDPDGHEARLLAIWRQVAKRFNNKPDLVMFELLNEPHSKLTDAKWNEMWPKVLKVVRESNKARPVIIGPGTWNNVNGLAKLRLPGDDRFLIGTFHYYSPFEFTHQGASWAKGSDKWKGRKWSGTAAEVAALRKDFDKASAWAKREGRPVYLGEFGAYSAADMTSRAAWTAAVAREAEKRGFAWSYWEFCSGFGAYDLKARAWRKELLGALITR